MEGYIVLAVYIIVTACCSIYSFENNSELVGAWGNFVNRTLAFAVKYLNSEISAVTVDNDIIEHVKLLYDSVGEKNRERCFQRGS